MSVRDLVYKLYERRLERKLSPTQIPRHVGVIVDGNRRWARAMGLHDVSRGHQKGADKISELLVWCREAGVEYVTLWLLSTDNLSRDRSELEPLLDVIEGLVQNLVDQGWHVTPMGSLDLLPDHTARVLKQAKETTSHRPGLIVNVAVGYGGRREIADAVRSLLQEQASKGASIEELVEVLDVEHIAEHLYTRGLPTRTSSSGPRESSDSPDSCSGRAPTPSSTSARPTGLTSAESISCGRSARTPRVTVGTDPDTYRERHPAATLSPSGDWLLGLRDSFRTW